MKICYKCKIEKETDKFNKKSKSKDGLSQWCKECHKSYKKKHYLDNRDDYLEKNKKRRRDIVNLVKSIKKDLKCEACGEDHPATLDFHHKDRSEKSFSIANMRSHSKQKVLKEIEKCEVLCSNCHRKKHWSDCFLPHSSRG